MGRRRPRRRARCRVDEARRPGARKHRRERPLPPRVDRHHGPPVHVDGASGAAGALGAGGPLSSRPLGTRACRRWSCGTAGTAAPRARRTPRTVARRAPPPPTATPTTRTSWAGRRRTGSPAFPSAKSEMGMRSDGAEEGGTRSDGARPYRGDEQKRRML